jgi:hypothetical protein
MTDAPRTMGEFRALPTIVSQFPLVFGNGARWETMAVRCSRCDTAISGDAFRGHVTRPFGAAFLMEAFGLCECGALTRASYRFLPDMTMVGRSPRDGAWSVWAAKRNGSWWRRLFRRVSRAVRGVTSTD